MATQKNTDVYLEAMEIAKNESDKPEKFGNARLDGIPKRKYP